MTIVWLLGLWAFVCSTGLLSYLVQNIEYYYTRQIVVRYALEWLDNMNAASYSFPKHTAGFQTDVYANL